MRLFHYCETQLRVKEYEATNKLTCERLGVCVCGGEEGHDPLREVNVRSNSHNDKQTGIDFHRS